MRRWPGARGHLDETNLAVVVLCAATYLSLYTPQTHVTGEDSALACLQACKVTLADPYMYCILGDPWSSYAVDQGHGKIGSFTLSHSYL